MPFAAWMADWNAGSAAMDSYESIAAEPAFQSAIHAANGNETEIAKLHTKHLSDFGGYYFADCVVALKGGHPLPAGPAPATSPGPGTGTGHRYQ